MADQASIKVDGFFVGAESDPSRLVWFGRGNRTVKAGDLLSSMNRTARGLRSCGVRAGDTIAVILSNRPEFMECYGAAIQTGLCFVAVNWHLTPGEMSYILTDSRARAVLTESRFEQVVSDAVSAAGLDQAAVFSVDPAGSMGSRDELLASESDEAPQDRSLGQIMFYTSGTTGRPKGVRKHFRTDSSATLTLTGGIGPIRRVSPPESGPSGAPAELVYLSSGPFYHGLPIAGVTNALDSGGVVVVMDKWTPEDFLRLVEQHRVTHAGVVPTMLHRLLALPEVVRRKADVSSLQAVSHGGSPCPVEVKRRIIDWWGPIVTESYSSTEGAGTVVTSEEWLRKPGTVGRPSPGVTIKILDEEGRELPTGEQGLVYMTPTMWDFEYHGDAAKTQATQRNGMFTVGDIGYLDEDGYLFLCDRKADTIISGGVNIYPAEVEAALLQHPAVRDVAVIGVPNSEWGEEVLAVVELENPDLSGPNLVAELIAWCQARVARYKCPKNVDFVPTLDRDPNGKLRKGIIRSRYWPEGMRRI